MVKNNNHNDHGRLSRACALVLAASVTGLSAIASTGAYGKDQEAEKQEVNKQEAKIIPAPPKDPAEVEAHRKAAEAVVDALNTKAEFAITLTKMLKGQLEQFADAGASEEGIEELRKVTLAFLEEIYVWDEIKPDFVKEYMNAFTVRELNKMAEFYGSPVGKKAMTVMPRVAAASARIGQRRLVENQEEFGKRVRPIFEKYLPESELPSAVDGDKGDGRPELDGEKTAGSGEGDPGKNDAPGGDK